MRGIGRIYLPLAGAHVAQSYTVTVTESVTPDVALVNDDASTSSDSSTVTLAATHADVSFAALSSDTPSVALGETLATDVAGTSSLTEAPTLVVTVANDVQGSELVAEAAALSAAQVSTATFDNTVSDAVTVSDSLATEQQGNVTEAVSVSASESEQNAPLSTVSEPVTVSAAEVGSAGTTQVLSDTVTLASSESAPGLDAQSAVVEAAGLTDQLDSTIPIDVAILETVAVNDLVFGQTGEEVDEPVFLDALVAGEIVGTVTIRETVTPDAAEVGVAALLAAVAEAATLSAPLAQNVDPTHALVESVNARDKYSDAGPFDLEVIETVELDAEQDGVSAFFHADVLAGWRKDGRPTRLRYESPPGEV